MPRCEVCDETEAVHHAPGDWHLCDTCYVRRERGRVIAITLAVIVGLFMLRYWQACVVST